MWGCNYIPFLGGWGRGFFPGGLWSLLIWGLAIWLVVYLVIRIFKSPAKNTHGSSQDLIDSQVILEARYARGDISREEFIRGKEFLLQ